MNLTTIKQMDVIYFLDRNAWNTNDPEALVIEMEIIEENGDWIAYAERGHEDILFKLNEELLEQVSEGERKYLFETKREAREHYRQELKKEKEVIQELPRTTLLRQFFDKWREEGVRDTEIIQAMRTKIKAEFGVNV